MKYVLLSFFCLINFQTRLYSAEADRVTLSMEINNKNVLEPNQWVNNFYKQLKSPTEKEEVFNIVKNIISTSQKNVERINQIKIQLKNSNDLYSIAMELSSLTTFDANVSGKNKSNQVFLQAIASFLKCIMIFPDSLHGIELKNKENFIKYIPIIQNYVINLNLRAEKCLQFMSLEK